MLDMRKNGKMSRWFYFVPG